MTFSRRYGRWKYTKPIETRGGIKLRAGRGKLLVDAVERARNHRLESPTHEALPHFAGDDLVVLYDEDADHLVLSVLYHLCISNIIHPSKQNDK